MYILPLLKNIVKLNWKEVTIFGYREEKQKIILSVRGKYNTRVCPQCGCKTNKRQDRKLHKQGKLLPHMPYGGDKMIFLEVHKRYFRCKGCKSRFYEKFNFESEHGKYSTHFEQYVRWHWGFISGNKIAELYQTSVSVIHSILSGIDENLINERGIAIMESLDEIYLGVDEHSFSGHDMILVITELRTGQLLAVLDGITKEKLDYWIWHVVPLQYHTKILGFSTDMNKGYAHSLKKICGDPHSYCR